MGWVRLSDDFYDHPKFDRAGPLGVALFAAGLAYCNRNLTDGAIPASKARRLLDFDGITWGDSDRDVAVRVCEHLVDCGLWDAVEDGYQVHDYLDYQYSAKQIQQKREQGAARQTRHRNRRAKAGNGERNADRNGVTDDATGGAAGGNGSARSGGQLSEVATDDDPQFTAFWDAYPLKKAKGQARKAWRKAVKDETDPEVIVAGAKRYRDDPRRKPDYTAHPATWLNGERWGDGPSPASSDGHTGANPYTRLPRDIQYSEENVI